MRQVGPHRCDYCHDAGEHHHGCQKLPDEKENGVCKAVAPVCRRGTGFGDHLIHDFSRSPALLVVLRCQILDQYRRGRIACWATLP
jgi:hypothetical protein